MRTWAAILLIIASLLCGQSAVADEVYAYSHLTCSPELNSADIKFAITNQYNSPWPTAQADDSTRSSSDGLAAESNRCRLKNGTEIEFEQGATPSAGGGFPCGFVSPAWINLWVNHKKVMNHRPFLGCFEENLSSVEIENNNIKICVLNGTVNENLYLHYQNTDNSTHCTSISADYPGLVDYERFPPLGGPIPSEGQALTYSSEIPGICDKLDAESGDNYYFHEANKWNIDFFNDGTIYSVYIVSWRAHVPNGDYLYVLSADNDIGEYVNTIDGLPKLEEKLKSNSIYLFNGDNSMFRSSFVYMMPFLSEGKTYLSVIPTRDDLRLRKIIYAGDPVVQMKTVCIFTRAVR